MNNKTNSDISNIEKDIENTELSLSKMKEILALPKTSVQEVDVIGAAIISLRNKWVDLRWKLFFANLENDKLDSEK